VQHEFELAYNPGDPDAARKFLRMASSRARIHREIDILKAEQIAQAQRGSMACDRADGGTARRFRRSRGAAQAGTVAGLASAPFTRANRPVWIIGMRYKIINAETTEQVAQGYTEEKMEVGAKSTSVLGVSQSQQGGVSLDTMVQRLVQKSVWEIDNKYK
jgi:hypothetical protein